MKKNARSVRRVIVETGLGKGPGEYGNVGDISMLQVCVGRLHELFPQARIQVLTDSAENLARFCPQAEALDNRGRVLWFGKGVLLGKHGGSAPGWMVRVFVGMKVALRLRFPSLLQRILLQRLQRRNRKEDAAAVTALASALQEADLFVMCGAGGFYDGIREWSLDILDLLETFIQRNTPAVLLGQGFGPIIDPLVLKRAAEVLPKVDLITIRGGRGSRDLLLQLGVPDSKIENTGDEALELAYNARSPQRGQGLGINMRFAGSSGTDEHDVALVKDAVQQFVRERAASLVPVPIAIHALLRDDLAIKSIFDGSGQEADGGANIDSPLKAIQQISRCRMIVTGAYHAAVFALAQGIPVVALAKSPYFAGKMLGLEDQFGEGCQTVLLQEANVTEILKKAMENAWMNADRLRGHLLETTLRQIASSQSSYRRTAALAKGASELN